jgi:filamentous hemagglutinin family protein
MNPLNKIYRTIWSEALGAWVAVSELVKSKGKRAVSSLERVLNIGGVDAATDDIHRHRFKLTALAALCLFSLGAQANPMGGQVVSGSASFNTSGNTLTVTNTPGAIIHWQDFSIQQNEITRFAQQSASSAVLNRVVGGNTSQILGSLQSNGRVFLVNPSGIVFGAGSTVDVAGLVATSLNLSDADFLAGRHRFSNDLNAQAVRNAGNISAQQGGEIWLIAPNVENSGVINAPNGEILLAAGASVELTNSLDPNLRVNITAPAGDATNVGQLVASAGRLGLFGTLVRNSGSVSADSATMQGGKIVFRSSQRTEITGSASATGTTGGTIEVLSGNEVQIGLDTALDASGTNGGGTILVGGDKQGLNPDVVNAKTTFVDAAATINADAVQNGDGGKVIVWADNATHAHGSITAKGGANGGDGGFVETSAHYLDVAGISVDASAPKGEAGLWMLDPLNVTIGVSPADTGGIFSGGGWTPTASGSFITTGTIQGALNAGTNVTITTVNGGFAEAGDINVNWSITKSTGAAATLTLLAENNINFAATYGISSTVGALNVVLHSDADANGTGTVTFAGTNTFSLLGGRVDLYYNPVSYVDAATKSDSLTNPYSGVFGATPFTAWMLVNDVGLEVGGTTGLQAMSTNLAGNYALGTNIVATATAGWNAGAGFASVGDTTTAFTGQFNGGGYSIGSLTINRSTTDYVGLFGYTSAATIKDVTLTGASITGQNYVGVLAGYMIGGTAANITIGGSVAATSNAGGLTGFVNGTAVSTSNSSVTVNSVVGPAGGLVGNLNSGSITTSSATGNVTAPNSSGIGGLVGISYGNITGSSAGGVVSGQFDAGGLVGTNYGVIGTGTATGNVSGSSSTGGLVGANYGTVNVNSSASGAVSGINNVGGLAGLNSGGFIDSSSSSGAVTGANSVGGLVGSNRASATVSNSFSTSNVSGSSYVGGLVGQNGAAYQYGYISNSHAGGIVTNANTLGGLYFGGLVGYSYAGNITGSYASGGQVSAGAANHVGGLVGYNGYISIYPASISNSWSSINVSGGSNVGGLVGYNDGPINAATIGGTYAIGTVTGNANVGGMVGQNYINGSINNAAITNPAGTMTASVVGGVSAGGLVGYNWGAISNSYVSAGSVSATKQIGGLVGFYAAGTVTNSFYDINAVTLNAGTLVTRNGLYGTQYAAWYSAGALTPLVIGNYFAQDAGLNYQIGTPQDLQNMLAFAEGGYSFIQTAALDLSTTPGLYIPHLAGNYDGAGFSVSTLNASVSINSGIGLFGQLAATYTVGNVALLSPTVAGARAVGSLVGQNQGNVTNSHASGVLASGASSVGGLVGYGVAGSTITNSYVDTGSVTASVREVGGLVGLGNLSNNSYFNIDTVTTNVANNVTRDGIYTTQFSAWQAAALTPLSIATYFTPDVGGYYQINNLADLQNVLPFTGDSVNDYNFVITANIDLTTLPGFYIPVLEGNLQGGNFTVSNLTLNLPNHSVGFIGEFSVNANSSITNLHLANASVSGLDSVGALVGKSSGNIDNASVTGASSVTGDFSVGGLVGQNWGQFTSGPSASLTGGIITNSFVDGGVVVANSGEAGGLVGINTNGKIDLSHALNTSVTGVVKVGGMVGSNLGGIWSFYQGPSLPNVEVQVGIVSNSYVTNGTITGAGASGTIGDIGGLVGGNNFGFITNGQVSATAVNGGVSSRVGGLVGYNEGGTTGVFNGVTWVNKFEGVISSSFVSGGTVSSAGANVGGLVGDNFAGLIDLSHVDGVSVTGTTNVGGLVGHDGGEGYGAGIGKISNSHALNTQVTGEFRVGGLVGSVEAPSISVTGQNYDAVVNSYVDSGTVTALSMTGVISGTSAPQNGIGGLVGYSDHGNVVGSYVNNTTVAAGTAASNAGGLVGFLLGGTTGYWTNPVQVGVVSGSYVTGGTVNGWSAVGGLVGNNFSGYILDSYVTAGNVSGGRSVGGLVGDNGNEILRSYVRNTTIGTSGTSGSASDFGGLAGANSGLVSQSFVSGGVVGAGASVTTSMWNVGGLVGWNLGAIDNSYVSGGTVSGFDMVGGLVGYNEGIINQNYVASGIVTAAATTANVGGLVGFNLAPGSVSNSYWDTVTTAQSAGIGWDNGGGTIVTNIVGLTTTQMQTMSSFAGWSIANTGGAGMTWRIYEGHTGPLLTSFLTQTTVTANDATKVYDGIAYSGDNGYSTSVAGVLLLGSIGGSSQGAVNAGSYVFDVTGLYSSQLGYDITGYTNGTLTITPAGITLLSITASDASKVYGDTYTFNGSAFIPVGLLGGDTIGSVTLSSAGAVSSANAGTYAITPSNAVFTVGSASNYSISYVNGTLTVTPRSITLSAPSLTRTYNGTTSYTATTAQLAAFSSALVSGDVVNAADMSYADKNAGTNKVVNFNSVAINDGNGGGNYSVTLVGNSTSTIDPASLVVTALPAQKVMNAGDPVTFPYSVVNLFDPVATVLSGTLARDPGELIGEYAIKQGSLTLLDTQNYTMTFVPGKFSIMAPAVVQEITQVAFSSGTPESDTTEEEKEKEEEQVLAEADIGNDQGSGLPDNLPVCR